MLPTNDEQTRKHADHFSCEFCALEVPMSPLDASLHKLRGSNGEILHNNMTSAVVARLSPKWPKYHRGACPTTRCARHCTIVAAAARAVVGCAAVEKRGGRTRAVGKRGQRVQAVEKAAGASTTMKNTAPCAKASASFLVRNFPVTETRPLPQPPLPAPPSAQT